MKRKTGRSQVITIISLMLVLIGLIVSFFFEETNEIITVVTTLTAVIGAFAVYVQIRKSKLIGQTSFTIEISKYFYEIPDMMNFVHKLGRSSNVDGKDYEIKSEDKSSLIKYLNYLKTIASLVEQKVITVETLNSVFAFEFFICINNKSVQEIEIRPYARFYTDIFELYTKWLKFRIKNGYEELNAENALSKIPEYQTYISGGEVK